MTRSLIALLSAGAIAVAVAACGGSSSSSSAGTSTSSSAGTSSSVTTSSAAPHSVLHSTVLTIAANPSGKLMFTKSSLSAKAGTITIKFTNDSPLDHNFTIQRSTDSATGAIVAATPTFHGGTKTLTVKLAAGTYTFFCSVPGHRQAGMHGTLTVT